MNKNIFDTILSYNKQQIVDILKDLVNNHYITEDILSSYTETEKVDDKTKNLIEKISNSKSRNFEEDLTMEENEEVKYIRQSMGNIKISSALASKNKLKQAIIKRKIDDCFEITWAIYPRKIGKQIGKKAYIKLIQTKTVKELVPTCKYIVDRVRRYANYCYNNNTEEQYILHFSTFCNSKKYL